MSSRRSNLRFSFAIAAAVALAGSAGVAISACSSTTTNAGNPAAEAGSDSPTDRTIPKPDSADTTDSAPKQTHAECIAACNAAHPNSVPKEKAIDTCWVANCNGPCVATPPSGFDAGDLDGGDAAPDASDLCGTGVNTGDVNCDNCTQAYCCPSWKGCFNDMDCTALDDCLGKCP